MSERDPVPTTTEPPFRASRYTTGAIVLHWVIAVLVILQIAGGYVMDDAVEEGSALQYTLFQLHKSVGVTVLLLTVARILWRLFNPPPADPPGVSATDRRIAGIAHRIFYVLLLAIPLAGWLVITVSPIQIATVLYFQDWLPWPNLPVLGSLSPDARAGIEHLAQDVHGILAYAMGALVLLHIGGAMKHQLKDGRYLRRMTGFAGGDGPRNAFGHATTVVTTLAIALVIIGSAGIARHTAQGAQADDGVSPDQAAVLGAEPASTAEVAAVGPVAATTDETPAASEPASPAAVVPQWAVRPDESALTFRFGYQSGEVVARFDAFDADIAFDPDHLDQSAIQVDVDLASVAIESGGVAMTQLRGPDGLAVDDSATATFTSDTIRATDEGYVAEGRLTLRSAEQPASLAFTLEIDGDQAIAHGSTTLERLAFDIGAQSDPKGGTVSPTVRIEFDLMADRQ